MPVRLLREGILNSERIDTLDAPAEVFYRRLMSKVDDHGLYDARPAILRASLYPLRVDRVREADITRWIAACEKAGVIALYQHDGKPYLQMMDTRWVARSEPKYPLPPNANTCAQVPATVALDVFGFVGVVVDGKIWSDFLKIRKTPMTSTALAGIQREANKAGLSLEGAIKVCCERGWQSLKADWLAGGSAVGVTVPGSQEPDPELERLKAHKGTPPSLETLAKLAELRRKAA